MSDEARRRRVAPVAAGTQPRGGCPPFALVPGYWACATLAGASCGFGARRCNDDTVVPWHVCGS